MKNPDTDRSHPNDWDDHFRQRFADFEFEPSINALTRILADLPTPAPAFNSRKTWLFGALGLLLLLIGSWFVGQRSWPISSRLTANSPKSQRQQQAEGSTVKTSAISGKLPSRAIISENKTETNKPIQPTISSDNLTIDIYGSQKRGTRIFPETERIETAQLDVNKKIVSENNESRVENAERPKAIDDPLPVSVEAPSSTIAHDEVESPKTIGKSSIPKLIAEKSQPVDNQLTDSQLVSTLKSATNSVAPEFEGAPAADKPSDSTPTTDFLSTQPMQPTRLTLQLPDINLSALPQSAPEKPDASRQRPTVFVGVMPLYTYQRIDPVQTDEIWVKNVTTQRAFSTQRAGLRFQAGVEWPIGRRISLRTSLIYNQLNQIISYSTPADKPDSVRVERVDEKTVRVIPYYNDKQVNRQTNWHYVGAGADFVFHLGKLGAWRHYTSFGATAGIYVTQGANKMAQPFSGFIQGAYGIERPLTPSVWLRLAPTVQYGLTTVSDADGLFRVRPYTYGLTIGLRK